MNYDFNKIEEGLNRIAAQLPMLEKTDLGLFSGIMNELDAIKKEEGLPPAFITQLQRTSSLIESIVMGDSDFASGCKKLGESIDKMTKSIRKMKNEGSGSSAPVPPVGKKEELGAEPQKIAENKPADADDERKTIPEDLKDLVAKFATNQQGVLEDFEAYILEWEKGDPQAKSAIKRVMHTWKGEFGVLDMQEYSSAIHTMEENLENGFLTNENLFYLKDFLSGRMGHFAEGQYVPVTEEDRTRLGAVPKKAQNVSPAAETPAASRAADPIPVTAAPEVEESEPYEGDPSLITDFINESRDHIHAAETKLLELETDQTNSEHIDCVFRAWHTIKGVAGFLNLKKINVMAHNMESLMDKARKHELTLTPVHIDLLLEGNDCLKTYVVNVEEGLGVSSIKVPAGYASLIKRLSSPEMLNRQDSMTDGPVPVKKIGEILVESGAITPQVMAETLAQQQAGDERKIGEILIEDKNVPARTVAGALASQTAARATNAIEETIRVPVNRIGQLVDTIGEAVIAQSMIYAHPSIMAIEDQSVHTKIAHGAMIMRSIQEMAMSLRMVSVKATFQKMARLARDLAKKCNRDVDFVTDGEDTELDKSVVEKIGDPLIHMVRNSVDHGIESPEERAKTGKPAKARVGLKAYHRAGNIYIEVSDDGKGLDRTAIYEKALSKGLCKADDRLTDEEIFRFIFLPGFSTAKQVTDVSGRGVGMDVVRRNIEALRGSCEITSKKGEGTTFTIRLPLTLAIVDGMIVRAGEDKYIIPTLAIIESLKPTAELIQGIMGKGKMIKVREELITMTHLETLFNGKKNGNGHYDATTGVVMIIEDMVGKKIGLHLDEIIGQQQVVIKNLGEGMGDVPGITGGAIMNDGTVSLILDVGGIVKLAQG